MRKQIFTLLLATLILGVCSCRKSSDEKNWVGGWEPQKIFVAYVESLNFPDAIYAGEEFEVKVTLSAQMQPEVLIGRIATEGIVQLSFPYSFPNAAPHELPLNVWYQNNQGNAYFFERADQTGEPRTEYIAKGIVYIPGDYVLILSAAESREFGGYQSYTTGDTFDIYPRDHVADFEFPYTVLPAPDEAE